MAIEYVVGDATEPQANDSEVVYIPHICNDIGAWGAGFVMALSRTWPEPQREYLKWHKDKDWFGTPFELGQIQIVNVGVGNANHVVNMVAQHGIRSSSNRTPIDYDALDMALGRLAQYAEGFERGANLSVGESFQVHSGFHMPRIGAGLAGGDWQRIEAIIIDNLKNFRVVVYDLP